MIEIGENFKPEIDKDLTEQISNQIEQIENEFHQKIVKKIVNNYLEFKKLLNF